MKSAKPTMAGIGRSPQRVFPDHAFMLHCTFSQPPSPAGVRRAPQVEGRGGGVGGGGCWGGGCWGGVGGGCLGGVFGGGGGGGQRESVVGGI